MALRQASGPKQAASDPARGSGARAQLRQPRLAEMVAEILRERIVSGQLPAGAKLPRQEDLLEEFSVSKPSMREALRILETEGLISVQRGKLGGAIVHTPQSHDAAYMLGLVLQAKHVMMGDVGVALQNLEPVCAALCAERADRRAVVRDLRRVHDAGASVTDDDVGFVREMRRFHEAVVAACGNETVTAVVGSLEDLWAVREDAWVQNAVGANARRGAALTRALRDSSVKAHARILMLIEKGDPEAVARAWNRHACATQHVLEAGKPSEMVDATMVRRSR